MRTTTADIISISESKEPISPKKSLVNFLIPENIKAALAQRIQDKIVSIEEERKLLEKKMDDKYPLIKKIELRVKMDAIKRQHEFLKDCIILDVVNGHGIEKEARFIDIAFKAYQADLKETAQHRLTDEETRLKARESKEEKGLLPYVQRVQSTITTTMHQYGNLKKPTVEEALDLFPSCSEKLVAISKSYSTYSIKRIEYEEKIGNLQDDLNCFLAIKNLCAKKELTLIELQNKQLLNDLISDKDNINVKDTGGLTSLHYACLLDLIDLAENLVKLGAKIDSRSRDGNFPIQFIARISNENTGRFLQLLLPKNKQDYMDPEYCKRLLLTAVDHGNLVMVDFLLNSLIRIQYQDRLKIEDIDNLISDSAIKNENNTNIETFLLALINAATKGHLDIVIYFLEKHFLKAIINYCRVVESNTFINSTIFSKIEHAVGRAYYYGHTEVILAFFKARVPVMTKNIIKYLDEKISSLRGADQYNLVKKIQHCEEAVYHLEDVMDLERRKQRTEYRIRRSKLTESKAVVSDSATCTIKNTKEISHLGMFAKSRDSSVIHPASIITELKMHEESICDGFKPHPASL